MKSPLEGETRILLQTPLLVIFKTNAHASDTISHSANRGTVEPQVADVRDVNILILTRNRAGHFDEAFESRVQLALPYKPLHVEQRLENLDPFYRHASRVEEKMELEEITTQVQWLASHEMNGRQIRDSLNTERQLARFSRVQMSLVHLKCVINVSQQFDEYIASAKHPNMSAEHLGREREDR